MNASVKRQTPRVPYSSANVGAVNWEGPFFHIAVQVDLPGVVQLEADVEGLAWEDSLVVVLRIRAPEGSGVTAELARAAPGTVREALRDHFRDHEDSDLQGVLSALGEERRPRWNELSLTDRSGFASEWINAANADASTLGLRRNDAVGRFRKLASSSYRGFNPEKVRYWRRLCVNKGPLNADGTAGRRFSELQAATCVRRRASGSGVRVSR